MLEGQSLGSLPCGLCLRDRAWSFHLGEVTIVLAYLTLATEPCLN